MVEKIIYVEGGASGPDSKELTIRCQKAFNALLRKMGHEGKMPRLKACGSRASVFEDFTTAHESGKHTYVAMWIDSEDPVAHVEKAWAHLAKRDNWQAPDGATDDQVLFMTACMETWIVADRTALKEHYGEKLHESMLPPLANLENRGRHDVQDKLTQATRDCSNAFKKGKRSYEVFETLNPKALESLPSFVRVARILNENL